MNPLFPVHLLRVAILSIVFGLVAETGLGQYRILNKQELTGSGTEKEQISQFLTSDGRIGWQHLQRETGLNGTIYERYRQTWLGLPVENAIIVVHKRNDRLFVSGHFAEINEDSNSLHYPEASDLIKRSAAFRKFSDAVSSKIWTWIQGDDGFELALKVDYFSQDDFSEKTVFLMPETAEIIKQHHHKCHLNQTGFALTHYHGGCQINTELHQSLYRLRSTAGGTEISTLNLNHQLNYGSVAEISDDDNYWEHHNHPFATDAHYSAEQYFHFLQGTFQRNSIDNAGYPLKSYVNYGQNLVNAFWNGSAVVYGSGNTSNGALTVIDIAGHEFTHGLIQKTAGLVYSNEPGTLNEAISDIFGEALDQSVFPANQTWSIAERTGQPLRSFSMPSLHGQPSEFHGAGWYYGAGDNGGVHINSGFINYWFYLLSDGGTGVNGKGWSYQLSGIGLNKAVRIVYESLIGYLVPLSGFEEFYHATLSATIDLYGYCSPEYIAVCEAWKAVGFKNQTEFLPVISTTTNAICQGDSVTLNAEGLPGSQFNWIYNGQPMNETGMVVSVSEQGSYRVTENRCGNTLVSDPIFLTVHALPVVTASNVSGCPGESLNLTGFPSGGIFSLPNPYSGPATTFIYTYTDVEGCSASASALIQRYQVHPPSLIASLSTVPVNDDPIVLLSDSGTFFSGTGVIGNLFYPELAGIGGPYPIEVSYTDLHGCVLLNNTEITVLPPCRNISEQPEIEFDHLIHSQGNQIKLRALKTENFEVAWKLTGGTITNSSLNNTEISVITESDILEAELSYRNTCLDSGMIRKRIELKDDTPWFFYPNPVRDHLVIECEGLKSLHIRDISGRMIKSVQFTSGQKQHTVITEDLNPGVYFLTIAEPNGESGKKFVKLKPESSD
jgi:Zn-dependent metalloprotease